MTEKQPDSQPKRGRADHLKPHQFKPGRSGNPGGLPKGTVQLSARIRNKLLEEIGGGMNGHQLADALAAKIVAFMLRDPGKAQSLISDMMDRDEGPVEKSPLISIDARGQVPQPPPLEPGKDGAPSFSEHLRRLSAIAKERGLADPMEQPQDVEAEITTTDD